MKGEIKVGRNGFPILGWREVVSEAGNPWHQCVAPVSVVGDVWEVKRSVFPHGDDVGRFMWNVRTMDVSRVEGVTPRGYAATLEAAKAIVECILVNTGTCDPKELP